MVREQQRDSLREKESIDIDKVEFKGKGKVFRVEIPENEVLLDEQKPFSEQPSRVQQALKKLAKDRVDFLGDYSLQEAIDENNTGGSMYDLLVLRLKDLWQQLGDKSGANPAEYVSKELNEYGVKGITYDGRQDGRCFVIFDDKAIDILDKYYQGAAVRARGMFNKATNTITIMPDANASTLTHELAANSTKNLRKVLRPIYARVNPPVWKWSGFLAACAAGCYACTKTLKNNLA